MVHLRHAVKDGEALERQKQVGERQELHHGAKLRVCVHLDLLFGLAQRQQLHHQLNQQINQKLQTARAELAYKTKLLASLGPEQTLERGYAIVTDPQGKVLKDALKASKGDALNVRLRSGRLIAEVTDHLED